MFNLDVVNYLIQIGFRFLFNATLCSYCIKFFSTSTPNLILKSSLFIFFWINNLWREVVLDFFIGIEVIGLRLNMSLGVGGSMHIFS